VRSKTCNIFQEKAQAGRLTEILLISNVVLNQVLR